MKTARQVADAGFTLLELLVAITILSLILVALSGGVHFAGSAWRKQEAQITRQGDINAVQAVLRQLLASGQAFEGSSQDLKFVAEMPAALARGGLFNIELYQSGEKLYLSWQPHFKGAAASLPKNETMLLDGVTNLDLSYYVDQKGWQRAVTEKSKSVDLIAIKGRLSDGRDWPSLMISPAINVSSKTKP
jgi:general secretion pathway protein J